ncbi:MAG: cyanophycin synthetase, partial [Adlercreutzia sp.]|nr:cyanophycin synthetase [Adlercreutzia sp.]
TYGATRTQVQLEVRGSVVELDYPLVGRFNVENVMTAFASCLHLGIPAAVIAEALATMPPVPGRLEQVACAVEAPITIYVDYAHTPDALAKAIASIQELTDHRTIVVFGCGGNRDASKRPIMGQAALAADYAVVTSDNPRKEDPDAIIADIVAGMEDTSRYEVEPDRRSAIARAIAVAQPGDAILLAGKGHEDYQLVGDQVLSFDDRLVAAEELERAFSGEGNEA